MVTSRRRALMAASMPSGGGGVEIRVYTTHNGRGTFEYIDSNSEIFNKYKAALVKRGWDYGVPQEYLSNNPLYIDDILVTEIYTPNLGSMIYFVLEDYSYYEKQLSSDYMFTDAYMTAKLIGIYYDD